MSLGIGRIIVIVALIGAGVAVLANGFSTPGTSAATISPSPSHKPHHSPSPSTGGNAPSNLPSPQAPAAVTFAVFNGTSAAGLAAQADQTLTTAGYKSGQAPANSPVPGIAKTTVYYRGGSKSTQNQSDAQQIADSFFHNAKVALLGPDFSNSVGGSVQIVVVLGQDYATSSGG